MAACDPVRAGDGGTMWRNRSGGFWNTGAAILSEIDTHNDVDDDETLRRE